MSSAVSRRKEEINEALLELSRSGVLVMGHDGVEPTFKVSRKFGEYLEDSALTLIKLGGLDKDPLGDVALLALAHWYGELGERQAEQLFNALLGVLRASVGGGS